LPIEVMYATRGTIILDMPISGNNIEEIFSQVNFVTVQTVGALIKYTRIVAYTDVSKTTQVFHVDMLGGGVAVAGFGGSHSVVKFKMAE